LEGLLRTVKEKPRTVIFLALLFVILVAVMAYVLPPGVDWHVSYRPAVYDMLAGRSLYHLENGAAASWVPTSFMNPPWALLPLIPIALLPESIGRAVLVLVGLISFAFTAFRLGGRRVAVIILLLSPPVVHGLLVSNMDWMVVLGFILPPQIGLFFVTIKPQMGAGVALFWLIEAWRKQGWRGVLKTFWPVTLVFMLSILVYGPWPLRLGYQISVGWNASLWPYTIPVGLALLVSALRKRKIEYAMAASPCLSPYLMMHSWVTVLLAIVGSLPETAAAVIGFWILIILRGSAM
jgi:hypothetical protein